MALVLNEEQRMLRDTAKEFIQANAPVDLMRQLRDEGSPLGYSESLWQQMVEMGWPAVAIPEAHGGLGFGYLGAGAILEEMGKTLAHSPFFSSVVLGASAIQLAGSEAQCAQWLPRIAAGEITLALAHDESNHHSESGIACTLQPQGDSWILQGSKRFVAEGCNADYLVVSAVHAPDADPGKVSLLLIDRQRSGINVAPVAMVDSRNYAQIEFDSVAIAADDLLGEPGAAGDALAKLLDYGRICLAAEMLGGAQWAFDTTVEYLKEREQFGQKIGSFQALQHRASEMYTELELTRSGITAALSAIDEDSDELPLMASLAKARMNETFRLIADEAVQMHGGIGLTDELNVGFYLKRCRVAMNSLGSTGYHKDRYATLQGF